MTANSRARDGPACVWNAVKHDSMNERKRPLVQTVPELVRPPAFPFPGNKIFERIGAAVSAARGYSLENAGFARLIGKSESTTSHWFGVFNQPHLVSCFCLLEQLAPLERHRVIDGLCRDLPILDHARLRHDPASVAALKNLLSQTTGLTVIVGGTDERRTFLLTALGHTFCRMDRRHRTAAGIDLHQPDWFVPVETMFYLKGSTEGPQISKLVRQVWPEITTAQNPLILLNGIWSAMPDLRDDILSLASRRHVVIADQPVAVPGQGIGAEHPVHVLKVSAADENPGWIAVNCARA